MSDREEIDQLAEAAALLDEGSQVARRASGDTSYNVRARDALREDAWLLFREAELRMQLAGMRNMRDITAVNVPLQQLLTDKIHEDDL